MKIMQGHPTPHVHQTPGAVLDDPNLATFDKRAILSSWASDRYAVESSPWLREVPGVHNRLQLADILSALRALDDDQPPPRGGAAMRAVGFARSERDPVSAFRAGPLIGHDALAARLAAHRDALERYRRILMTPLTDLERAFVMRRMDEERARIDRLEREMDDERPLALWERRSSPAPCRQSPCSPSVSA
jgi:hypothetical protein